jgi:hypothetical protein
MKLPISSAAARRIQTAAAILAIVVSLSLIYSLGELSTLTLLLRHYELVVIFISIYIIAFLGFSWIVFGDSDP